MNVIALAACILLVFCHGSRHHRPVVKSHVTAPISGTLDATGKNCDQIIAGFAGDQDEWVRKYPVKQQRRVLLCLDEIRGK